MAASQDQFSKICYKCKRCLNLTHFYSKGPVRLSSSCRACELARKKEQWLKNKRKKSPSRSKNIIDADTCQISFIGKPSLNIIEEYLKELLSGVSEK